MLVQDFLHASVARRPGKVALVWRAHRYTYAQIEDMANRLAHALCQGACTWRPRWRVSPEQLGSRGQHLRRIESWRGVRADANPGVKPTNCSTSSIIAAPLPSSSMIAPPRGAVSFVIEISRPSSANSGRAIAGGQYRLDLACLIYTSGSTGEPKGVMCDHSNITFAASSIIQYLGNTENDIVINTRPLSFDYGLYQLLMTFKFGGTWSWRIRLPFRLQC